MKKRSVNSRMFLSDSEKIKTANGRRQFCSYANIPESLCDMLLRELKITNSKGFKHEQDRQLYNKAKLLELL